MHTLLFGANLADARRLLGQACGITRRLMPNLGYGTSAFSRTVGPFQYWYMRPNPAPPRPLINEASQGNRSVLIWGELFDSLGQSAAAQHILEVWTSEGIEAVRRLDGSFSAILMNTEEGTVHIVSDMIGRRPFRWLTHHEGLLISNHDLPIVATGLCPLEYDVQSACSILVREWSLGGATLLKSIRLGNPQDVVHWRPGELVQQRRPLITLADRLDPKDTAGQARCVESMIDSMRERIRRMFGLEPRVDVELTAGLDTRAALAASISVIPGERLVGLTMGPAEHADARMAKRLAAACGIRYEMVPSGLWSLDDFLENARVLAFFMNGETNSKRAVCSRFQYDPNAPVHLGGGGGELYRGGYYPRPQMQVYQPMSVEDTLAWLLEHLSPIATLPWGDPGMADALRSRLAAIVAGYSTFTRDGHDIIDLFDLFEDFGRWGLGARLPMEERRYYLYESTDLITKAYRLPAPIGYRCTFHKRMIKRYLRSAYWWPVNDTQILPLELSPCKYRLPPHRRVAWIGIKRLRQRLASRYAMPAAKGLEDLQREGLSQVLHEGVGDLLTSGDSFGTRIFGQAGIRRMLNEYITTDTTYPLGPLITLELWRTQIAAARQMALTPKCPEQKIAAAAEIPSPRGSAPHSGSPDRELPLETNTWNAPDPCAPQCDGQTTSADLQD